MKRMGIGGSKDPDLDLASCVKLYLKWLTVCLIFSGVIILFVYGGRFELPLSVHAAGGAKVSAEAPESGSVDEENSLESADPQRLLADILSAQCDKYGTDGVGDLIESGYAGNPFSGTVMSYMQNLYNIYGGEELPVETYFAALNKEMEAEIAKDEPAAATLQKAAVLYALYGEENPAREYCLSRTIGQKGIMTYIYGIHMLTASESGASSAALTEDPDLLEGTVRELLTCSLEDGGFSIMGSTADTDVTAMAMQALAEAGPYLSDELCAEVETVLSEGTNLLSSMQGEDGSYGSMGVQNVESTSQVMITLCELGISVREDERFIKNGSSCYDALLRFYCGNGFFSHLYDLKENDLATSQAMQALIAMCEQDGSMPDMIAALMVSSDGENTAVTAASDGTTDGRGGLNPILKGKIILTAIFLIGFVVFVLHCIRKQPALAKKRALGAALVIALILLPVWILQIRSEQQYKEERLSSGMTQDTQTCKVTMQIICDTIGREPILEKCVWEIPVGTTVFELLVDVAKEEDIPIEYRGEYSPGDYMYIEGIGDLYEFDYGDLSGWMYQVNGAFPRQGCAEYRLQEGDEVTWAYTLNVGIDLGDTWDMNDPDTVILPGQE